MLCSFCGKHVDEITILIQGPGVTICDECIQLCVEVVMRKHREHYKALQESNNLLHYAEVNHTEGM